MSHHALLPQTSAFYQQRSQDAIHWHPWAPRTFQKARGLGKPIFLHIGYGWCHWCERMASEAFRHPAIATYISRYFIPVALDRDQRPDLANAFMHVTAAMTGKTGWPLNLFLTPEGKPYYGGTYFPPQAEVPGTPTFQEALAEALRAWEEDRERVEDIAQEMARQMGEGLLPLLNSTAPLDLSPEQAAAEARANLESEFDAQNGGFGEAPKFPQPLVLLWLLRRAEHGDERAQTMALTSLLAMARGGIYDVLGGGFHQYTLDAGWREPRFEKSLPTNALLAQAYTTAYRLTGQEAYRQIASRTLDYLTHTLALPNGLLGSGQSGESESPPGEGRYYMWTAAEVRAALPADEADLLIAAYDLAETPRTLQRHLTAEALEAQFGLPTGRAHERVEAAKARLLAARQRRMSPPVDDTAITAWNALAIRTFAQAGRDLDAPRYTQTAVRIAEALLTHVRGENSLGRSWYRGQIGEPAFLEDYAAAGWALLALHKYQAPLAPDITSWLYEATWFLEQIEALFAAEWGYYDTTPAHNFPFGRPQELLDGDAPSGNALAATLLAAFAKITHQNAFQVKAQAMLDPMMPLLVRHPTAFPQWLFALECLTTPSTT